MIRFYIEAMPQDVIRNIREQAYSNEKIAKIHSIVKDRHLNKQKGFRRAMTIVIGAVALVMTLALAAGPEMPKGMLLIQAGFMAALILVMTAVCWYAANKMTLQFVAALRKGYPHLEDKYGFRSFKK